jgi:L-alanine-DL-glutamate epimerase-like enolase superfamily enzyme
MCVNRRPLVSQHPLTLNVALDDLPLKTPFRISGHTFLTVPVALASLSRAAICARGEAAGVYYLDDPPAKIAQTLYAATDAIQAGISRTELRDLLPSGGARNAVDCALWDLEARESGRPAWTIAGLAAPKPLLTTFTLGADSPVDMAAAARALVYARALKLKLTGDADADIDRVRAVRMARRDVWMAVDANQGFTPATLERLIPVLADCDVSLLEQPFPRGREQDHEGLTLPMPVAADESCQNLAELDRVALYFDAVNIKLDKCGGLTEALMMAARARELGLQVMVGNMVGTSLAMAPAFLLGQLCDIVDLDGPTFLQRDRSPGVRYIDGSIWCPADVWG